MPECHIIGLHSIDILIKSIKYISDVETLMPQFVIVTVYI